jgi:hypothetical protein
MFFTGLGLGNSADYPQIVDFKQINANKISMICQLPSRKTIFLMVVGFADLRFLATVKEQIINR